MKTDERKRQSGLIREKKVTKVTVDPEMLLIIMGVIH